MSANMDLPFEEQPTAELDLSDAVLCGGIVVMSAIVPTPIGGNVPALVLRFTLPDGQFLPPVVLAMDRDQLLNLGAMVTQAGEVAVRRSA